MDDLDRLAFRLVRTVRNSYPHLLEQEFTLTDLEERLLPFRDTRREMSNSGPEAWEINVLRMVSGEREYLRTDADLQLACRQALSLPSPTLALIRPWSATTLRLGAAVSGLGSERQSSGFSDPFAATAIGLEFSSDPLRLATPSISSSVTAERPIPRASGSIESSGARMSGVNARVEQSGASVRVSGETVQGSVQGSGAAEMVRERIRTPDRSLGNCGCRYCGGKLPDGRKMTFCPHCGVNLTVRQCPACSTELDVNWRFCVTCGRGAELPELPQSLSRASGA